jgi:hypothetical protein
MRHRRYRRLVMGGDTDRDCAAGWGRVVVHCQSDYKWSTYFTLVLFSGVHYCSFFGFREGFEC